MKKIQERLSCIIKSILSLPIGMKVTLRYLFGESVTMQYPEEKIEMTPRFRGVVTLVKDETTGKHRCIACMNCVRACPNNSLSVEGAVGEDKKKYPVKFTVNVAHCMFCGLCVESCPTKALDMSKEHEIAFHSREEFVRSLLP